MPDEMTTLNGQGQNTFIAVPIKVGEEVEFCGVDANGGKVAIRNPGLLFIDDIVILHTSAYKRIFGERKGERDKRLPYLSLVKISTNSGIVYRRVKLVSPNGFSGDYAALSGRTLSLLGINGGNGTAKITIKPVSRIESVQFLLRNYDYASYVAGVSLVLAGVAFVMQIVQIAVEIFLKCFHGN